MKEKVKLLNNLLFIAIFVCLLLIIPKNVCASGFGVSPGRLILPNLTPGNQITKEFQLSRSGSLDEVAIKIEINSDTLKEFVSFENINDIKFPKDKEFMIISLKIVIPEKTLEGTYKGEIKFILENENETSAVQIQPAIEVPIELSIISDKFVDFELLGSSIDEIVQNEDIILNLKIGNNGNAKANPERIMYKLIDPNKNLIEEKTVQINEQIEPFSEKVLNINISNLNYQLGLYEIQFEIFYNEISFGKDSIKFKIIAGNDIGEILGITDINNKNENKSGLLSNLLIIFGILILIISISGVSYITYIAKFKYR